MPHLSAYKVREFCLSIVKAPCILPISSIFSISLRREKISVRFLCDCEYILFIVERSDILALYFNMQANRACENAAEDSLVERTIPSWSNPIGYEGTHHANAFAVSQLFSMEQDGSDLNSA